MNIEKLYQKQKEYLKVVESLPEIVLEKINNAFDIEFTHNSTAIEGNTLSLIETKLLIEDKLSVGGKHLREIYEVINNHKANLYVKENSNKKLKLNEDIIKEIHFIINENIFLGGSYRSTPVRISGANFIPPVGQAMYDDLKLFYDDLQKNNLNPIELAAWTHAEFVRIHPFIDGNGRTSRQILNYQLLLNDFPPISISFEERYLYYEALDEYGTNKNITPFLKLVYNLVEKRLDEFLSMNS